jgi:hypothetical protein
MANITLKGKIENISSYEGNYYHDLVLPAPDSFTSPVPVSVQADKPLGQVGQEIAVECVIRSYYRLFDKKDGTKGRDYKTRFIAR